MKTAFYEQRTTVSVVSYISGGSVNWWFVPGTIRELNSVLYRDDALIAEVVAQKRHGYPEGITVTVEQIIPSEGASA